MNRANGNSLAEQGSGKYGSNPDTSGERRLEVILRFRREVMYVNGSSVNCGSAGYRVTIHSSGFSAAPCRQRPEVSYGAKLVTINSMNHDVVGIAEPRCTFDKRIQYRLNIRRRAGDYAQDLTSRRLLLQRLLEFLEQSNILDRDHGLVGEGL
jgi:hypothetical protein